MDDDLEIESQLQAPIAEWVGQHTPYWANQVIQPWDNDLLEKAMLFVENHYWSDRHSINVFNVVGTAHPDYIGMTWHQLLSQGKRMRANQRALSATPNYYHEIEVKHPSMLYVSVDGHNWYVNGDGNHRTCIARFQFDRLSALGKPAKIMVHGVTVDNYRIDWEFFQVYQDLQKVLREQKNGNYVEPIHKAITREDGPGWKNDTYETKLKCVIKGEESILDKKAAYALFGNKFDRRSGGVLAKWLSR